MARDQRLMVSSKTDHSRSLNNLFANGARSRRNGRRSEVSRSSASITGVLFGRMVSITGGEGRTGAKTVGMLVSWWLGDRGGVEKEIGIAYFYLILAKRPRSDKGKRGLRLLFICHCWSTT